MKIEAASGAQTQTCVCRNLNQNECTRRRAMGVGTQDSTRRRFDERDVHTAVAHHASCHSTGVGGIVGC